MEQQSSNEEPNWFTKLTNTLDQNIRGVQIGLYGLGFAGLIVAFRSVRPLQKFSRPSSIPRSFIEKQVPLVGQVRGAELSDGTVLLHVAHTPVVPLGRAGKPPYLPVALAGVSPTQLGLSWIQITLQNQPITFTVLAKGPHAATAQIIHQGKDVSAKLVELGFARIVPFQPALEISNPYKKLYSLLLKCERSAERHGNGMWHGSAPLHWRLADKLTSRMKLLMLQIMPKRFSTAPAIR